MMNSNRFLCLMLIMWGFHATSIAQDASSRLEKLVKGADVILTGKVTQKKSSWNDDKTRIYTKTTLDVEEYLKGKKGGTTVEVTHLGGEVGDVGELYSHVPTFEPNEEVLVFLKKNEKSQAYEVLNGEQGKIRVRIDAKRNQKVDGSDIRIKALKAQIQRFLREQ